jgi:hypothetical protein
MRATVDAADDYLFCELLPSCLTVVQGKKKHIDEPFIVRPLHEEDSTNALVAKSTYSITEDGFSQRYVQFRNRLVEVIVADENMSTEKARDAIDSSFQGFAAQNLIDRTLVQGRNRCEMTRAAKTAKQIDRVGYVLRALPRSLSTRKSLLGMIRAPGDYAKLLCCEGRWISTGSCVPVDDLLGTHSRLKDALSPIVQSVMDNLAECPLSSVTIDVGWS